MNKSTIGSYTGKKVPFESWRHQWDLAFLLGVGLDTSVWECVMLGVKCSVCRSVIHYHTRAIFRQSTGAWQSPRASFFSQVG